MGHNFDAASSLNNTNTSRSLYCGSPLEGERRGAGYFLMAIFKNFTTIFKSIKLGALGITAN